MPPPVTVYTEGNTPIVTVALPDMLFVQPVVASEATTVYMPPSGSVPKLIAAPVPGVADPIAVPVLNNW